MAIATTVLVVGESLVDVVIGPSGSVLDTRPGGAPLNIAVGLARLEIPTQLLTTYGDDVYGGLVEQHALDSDVRLVPGSRTADPTSVARALLDETQAASYEFDLRWAPPALDLPAGLAGLHVGSIGTAQPPGDATVLRLAEQAIAAGVPVTYDPNVRPAISPDPVQAWEGVRRWAGLADVVKLSDDDAAYLQPGPESEADADAMLDMLLAQDRTRLAVVTCGGDGTRLATRRHRVDVPAPPVAVVDTVGAGDSFMSGLIAALLDRDLLDARLAELTDAELREVGGFAAAVAAVTCSRRGADPPRRADL
ncbi:MAG: carbohydrate kinase [Propionibacteriales bacterium]|nr:carbohydrate kinase [Propionibacteriales bacterium]